MTRILKFLSGAATALLLYATTSAFAQAPLQLDPGNASDAQQIMRKMQCSTMDGRAAVFTWHGQAFGRRQGEKDVHLFNVEGMNIRACSTIKDAARGAGFALVSREILLYLDKETGAVLTRWKNPYTDEWVSVQHVANDPVNQQSYEMGRDGKPAKWDGEIKGDQWWSRLTLPLWYPSPLASRYEREVGGTYHATELFNFFGRTTDLLDPATTTAKVSVGWTRMSDWLPWMHMNGREGLFWLHTAGSKVASFEDLSDTMKREIRTNYPAYVSPPPTGDARGNMTSWQYYKEASEGLIKPPSR